MKKIISLVIVFLMFLPALFFNKVKATENETSTVNPSQSVNIKYARQLNKWLDEGLTNNHLMYEEVSPLDFIFKDGQLSEDINKRFVYDMSQSDTFDIKVETHESGLFHIGIEYFSINKTIRDISLEVLVNNNLQFHEASQIILKNMWEADNEFQTDRYNNDIMPRATIKDVWVFDYFKDPQLLEKDPLLFYLEEGENIITINKKHGEFLISNIYLRGLIKYDNYESYLNKYKDKDIIEEGIYTKEGENPLYRNDLSIKYGTDRNSLVTPFALMESRLNILDANSFSKGGRAITYEVDVKKEGLYNVTFKSQQPKNNNNVFRTIYINGEIPFEEAKEIKFMPSLKWKNYTLKNDNENYLFYFKEGKNYLTIEVNSSPFQEMYLTIEEVMNEINELGLNIKKITGGTPDKNQDFNLEENIPNLKQTLLSLKTKLETVYEIGREVNGNSKNTEININLKRSIELLDYFYKSPNKIPRELTKFNVGNNSILQKLGIILPMTVEQPLSIDKLYIHGTNQKLPKVKDNFIKNFWIGVRRFFLSFFTDAYNEKVLDDEIEVWVNRSRQYVDLMQQLVDRDFTEKNGIKVKISIMPNEDKLILATSSNTQPDVALGVAGWRPYDFAIRNALVDLRTLEGFYDIIDDFKPGAFAQLIYQEGIYGLPETQNFNLLFYRTDILNNIRVEVPDTWNDVLDMLLEISRYGLSFYSPLSNPNAFKAYINTMPFINQFGGVLYSDDLLSSNLTHPNTIEAINFMAELYTIYSLPLEVGSFYNQFRYGTIPIGIGDFGMYVQLLHAAPELQGLWNIAPMPGILKEDGFVDRSYDGAATSGIIFKNSKNIDESWEFLKWWTSAETQLEYSESLITSLGPEYMWNTSNVEAFKDYSWEEYHKEVILEQWKHIFDTPKTPASYMMEREISNIWNKVVYDGAITRTAISDSEIIINKEITKKLIEFGYLDNKGNFLKPYLFPTKETIDWWLRE